MLEQGDRLGYAARGLVGDGEIAAHKEGAAVAGAQQALAVGEVLLVQDDRLGRGPAAWVDAGEVRDWEARPVLHAAFAPAAHERGAAAGGTELDTGGAEQASGGGCRPAGEQLNLLQTEPAAFVQVGDKADG